MNDNKNNNDYVPISKYNHAIETLRKIRKANADNPILVDFIDYEFPELKPISQYQIAVHQLYCYLYNLYNGLNNPTPYSLDIDKWLSILKFLVVDNSIESISINKQKFVDELNNIITGNAIDCDGTVEPDTIKTLHQLKNLINNLSLPTDLLKVKPY